MIISRYLLREIVLALLVVTGVLYVIFVSNRFVRMLAAAEGGNLPAEAVVQLLAFKSISSLETLLPMALFFAVLIAFGRLYKDNEIVALAASGVGIGRLLGTVLWAAFGFAGLVAGISLYAGPWAEEQSSQILDALKTDADTRGVAEGRFRELRDGKLVFYVERLSEDGRTMEKVFVETQGKEGIRNVLSAERGYYFVEESTGDRYLILQNGYRYEGRPGDAQFKIIQFNEHGLLIEERALVTSARKVVAYPTPALIGATQPWERAELQWRIAMPLATVLLAALAVPLSRTTPRQGRFAKLFVAIVVYVVYMNLLVVSRSWLEQNAVSPYVGMWWAHGLLLVLVAVLVARQSGVKWRLPAGRAGGGHEPA